MKSRNYNFILRIIRTTISILSIASLVYVLSGNFVNAQVGAAASAASTITGFVGISTIGEMFFQLLGWLINSLMMVTSLFVSMTAAMLNISIVITLHIREFVDSTPVIYEIWRIIRDISGIFFIFVLLYEAIKIIVGFDAKIGDVIKNIVFAGVLINFSFFFVSIMIDASNVVSQALYNSMIPNSPSVLDSDFQAATSDGRGGTSGGLKGLSEKYFTRAPAKGSISDIFMQSLSIQSLYNKDILTGQKTYTASGNQLNNSSLPSKIAAPLKIILIGATGIIIMITTSLSFLLAAIAFIIRLVILLFLLAFSPLLFAGMVVPKIGDYTKDFKNQLEAQLIFMPVYLLLMYAALRVLNESKIFGVGYSGNLYQAAAGTSGAWGSDLIVLAINFAMVIIMLNFPLVAAFKLGGNATKLLDGWSKKFNAGSVWKNVGAFSGRNTAGRLASRINESNVMKNIYASAPTLGRITSKQLSNISSAEFGVKGAGFDQTRKAKIEGVKKFAEGLGYNKELVDKKLKEFSSRAEIDYDFNLRAKEQEAAELQNLVDHTSDPVAKAEFTTKLQEKREEIKNLKDNKTEKLKEKITAEETRLKNERKTKVQDEYNKGMFGQKPSKLNKMIVDAIKKEKKPGDEIMEMLKKMESKPSGEAKPK